MPRQLFKTALALSGGGSRALAHLGALDEIVKHRVQLDLITGTSMGAIIGGLYAYYQDLPTVTDKLRNFLESELFIKTLALATENEAEDTSENLVSRFLGLFRKGIYYTHSMVRSTLVSEELYLEVMSRLIPDDPIEGLPIPFAAVALDIVNGEEIVLRRGSLRRAVSASVAIPGILPGVRYDGRCLVDGGWIDNLPATPAIAMGAHFVIGIDASSQVGQLGPLPNSALDTLHRCNDITRMHLSQERGACADALLVPHLGHLYWADFSRVESCIEAGHEVVRKNIGRIRRKRKLRRMMTLNGSVYPGRAPGWRRPLIFY
ncbi:patatin-like phospholipase family protein [Desulfoferrobacter suflitae]|uniref:patatin-like phospholipase family protein n=1 Tax=Desulfoferrobacter suflitae TaxID=2865782 RepID=UPI002164A5BB|nr:patatin-like phospholipase family protein [Desulfoferrobacter suflitae]MCK8603468.1 patatin-like phospholipase family protein [Desulfoferrobacter suflitae]